MITNMQWEKEIADDDIFEHMLFQSGDILGLNDEELDKTPNSISYALYDMLDSTSRGKLTNLYGIRDIEFNEMLEKYRLSGNGDGFFSLLDPQFKCFNFMWEENHVKFMHGPK